MRLIDADATLAFERFDAQIEEHTANDVLMIIQTSPTIDPIRAAGGCYCGECKQSRAEHGYLWCLRYDVQKQPNGFCDEGKTREAQDDG